MARIAEVLGRTEDAARYAELSVHVRDAWQAEYLDAEGRLTPDTQANHVRALAFDLVPAELRPAVAERLVELIRKADTHLGHRLPRHAVPAAGARRHRSPRRRLRAPAPGQRAVVAGHGRPRRDHGVGARGTGSPPTGVPHDSLNHYSKGAVVSFLHRYTAGIEPLEPAYRRFRVQPRPGGGLTSAEAAHESPYGRIESAWQLDGGTFDLRVVVPAGTEAEVVLPDGSTDTAGPGEHHFTSTMEDAR